MSSKAKYLDVSQISRLPQKPGVYIFKNGKKVLYIGKSSNIRKRVINHFQEPTPKDKLLAKETKRIGYIETGSEIGALILEAQLIKEQKPRYNIIWRDDKNYFYVGITKEDFPRIFITHQIKKSEIRKKTSDFGFRTSDFYYVGPFVDGMSLKQTLKVLRKVFPYRTCRQIPKRPCLWYQLGRCPGPCILKTKSASQLPKLREKIKKECQRNAKHIIKILQGKQSDVLKALKREMIQSSQTQEYERAIRLRNQIQSFQNILQHAEVLRIFPKNPEINWHSTRIKLKHILGATSKIKRIEGYDISNIQGKQATGSMVVFENGVPNKKEYRKFKIKIAGKPNDVAMLKEVIARRLKHEEWRLPEVMLIDGGKGQLNAVVSILRGSLQRKVKNICVSSLAKKRNELFVAKLSKPLLLSYLPQDVANLILKVRDEAHRFAITYHKKIREREMFQK